MDLNTDMLQYLYLYVRIYINFEIPIGSIVSKFMHLAGTTVSICIYTCFNIHIHIYVYIYILKYLSGRLFRNSYI